MLWAIWTVNAALIYAAFGVLFAIAFAWRGAARLDPVAGHGSLGFRLVTIPAAAALWPLLAWRWVRAARPGDPA